MPKRSPRKQDPTGPDAVEERRLFLWDNRQSVSDLARQSGTSSIVVADISDEAGKRFEALDDGGHAARMAGKDGRPTVVWAAPPEFVTAFLADYPSATLSPLPPGYIQVFVFAAGGVMHAKMAVLPEIQAQC